MRIEKKKSKHVILYVFGSMAIDGPVQVDLFCVEEPQKETRERKNRSGNTGTNSISFIPPGLCLSSEFTEDTIEHLLYYDEYISNSHCIEKDDN